MLRAPIIDIHAHMLEPVAYELGMSHSPASGFGSQVINAVAGTAAARSNENSFDPERHIESMDRLGIDAEVLSSTAVVQGTSWTHPQHELELVQGINGAIKSWATRFPTRFVPSCVLPLLDRAYTIAELKRCVDDGFRAVELPAAVRGVYLGEPQFRYLWELIRELDITVFIHPDGIRDPWFTNYALWNSIGQGIEEVKVISSLIYEGILEDFSDLKIVVAHGGGLLPHNPGRLDRNVIAWPDSTRNISRKPSDYLRSLYFDTCLFDPTVLEALVKRVGADRLVLGSDFPIGERDPVGFVTRCEGLSASEQSAILGGTAGTLLGVNAIDDGVLGVH